MLKVWCAVTAKSKKGKCIMKMTKKQTAALQRINKREEVRRPGNSGLHPSAGEEIGWYGTHDWTAISDGQVVVLLYEKPDGLRDAERYNFLCQHVDGFLKDDRSIMVNNPSLLDECKNLIRDWKKDKSEDKPEFPKIAVSSMDDKGETITGTFNALLLLDALEALGPHVRVYIGYDQRHTQLRLPHQPCLTLYKRIGRDWWSENDLKQRAFLLPCRHKN